VSDVPAADPAVAEPAGTDVPLLMLPGQFDSFSQPTLAEAQAARLPMAWTIAVPGQTHNTLGFAECAITARNQWAQDPTTPPDEDARRAAPPHTFSTDT
jgi:pimeloyl-ACP methyl ester carboxylesterase